MVRSYGAAQAQHTGRTIYHSIRQLSILYVVITLILHTHLNMHLVRESGEPMLSVPPKCNVTYAPEMLYNYNGLERNPRARRSSGAAAAALLRLALGFRSLLQRYTRLKHSLIEMAPIVSCLYFPYRHRLPCERVVVSSSLSHMLVISATDLGCDGRMFD